MIEYGPSKPYFVGERLAKYQFTPAVGRQPRPSCRGRSQLTDHRRQLPWAAWRSSPGWRLA